MEKEKQTYTIEVKCQLTEDERDEAGRELARREKQSLQIERDRKNAMAGFKEQKEEVLATIAELSDKVTLGYEYRKFRCVREFDFNRKLRVFRNIENGKVVDERPLEADDYQMRLA